MFRKKLNPYLAVLALSLAACASSIKKYDYPPTTNSTDEIQRLEGEMTTAVHNQVNVTSPKHFADARKKLEEAKKENQNHASNADVLSDLGYARAHLDAANAVTPKVEAALPEVLKAREDALSAEAPRLRNADLIDADNTFKKTTTDFENGNPSISVDKRGDLQKMYLRIELASIKANYLDESKALIEAAKKMGAEKYANSTLVSAESKYHAAERIIETDHSNTPAIIQASQAASMEAKRAVEITRLAKGIKGQTPEEAAIALEAKRNEAARNATLAEKNADRLDMAQSTIRDKNSQISAIGVDNSRLEEDKRFNEEFQAAQKKFSSDEAEVYRQGDKLVVRLKTMQFPPGRAELPESSFSVLSKVKEVIESMGADKVTVEGHTDALGSPSKNMKLSEKRAEAVAKYFKAESVPTENIETKGYGDTRPLVSNKTKDGRAQNRRVDIVISASKDSSVKSSQSSSMAAPGNTAPENPAPANPAPANPPKWEE